MSCTGNCGKGVSHMGNCGTLFLRFDIVRNEVRVQKT
jgi:hypothetical protein